MRVIWDTEKVSEIWRENTLIPIFKRKGAIQNCQNYRRIELKTHTLKLLERMMDVRLRDEVLIG